MKSARHPDLPMSKFYMLSVREHASQNSVMFAVTLGWGHFRCSAAMLEMRYGLTVWIRPIRQFFGGRNSLTYSRSFLAYSRAFLLTHHVDLRRDFPLQERFSNCKQKALAKRTASKRAPTVSKRAAQGDCKRKSSTVSRELLTC